MRLRERQVFSASDMAAQRGASESRQVRITKINSDACHSSVVLAGRDISEALAIGGGMAS